MAAPTLSLSERLKIVAQSQQATARMIRLLDEPEINVAALRDALEQGAVLADISWTVKSKDFDPGCTVDLWDRLMERGTDAAVAAVLDADAQSPKPRQRTARLLIRAAFHPGGQRLFNALLDRGAKPNARGECIYQQRGTALAAAVAGGNDWAVDRLLDAGADPHNALDPPEINKETQKRYGPLTLLHLARTPHAIRRLLAAGVDPNAPDAQNRTPLACVIERTRRRESEALPADTVTQMVEALLDGGAWPEDRQRHLLCGWHWNVVSDAFDARLRGLTQRLKDRGLGWPPESPPRFYDMERFLAARFDIDWKTVGSTWLAKWLEHGDLGHSQEKVTKILLVLKKCGLCLESPHPTSGAPPLILAFQHGNPILAEALLHAGADATAGGLLPKGWSSWRLVLNHLIEEDNARSTDDEYGLADAMIRIANNPAVKSRIQQRLLETSTATAGTPAALKQRL